MKVTVQTQSGSNYIFVQNGDEVQVIRNYTQEGILAGDAEIEIGKPFNIMVQMLNQYDYSQEENISWMRSTPVKKVTISKE